VAYPSAGEARLMDTIIKGFYSKPLDFVYKYIRQQNYLFVIQFSFSRFSFGGKYFSFVVIKS
jgi:hypothetical protein